MKFLALSPFFMVHLKEKLRVSHETWGGAESCNGLFVKESGESVKA